MSSSSGTLQFCFPGHGDSILKKMNALREERRFCDVTLLLGGSQDSTVQPLHFHGHRVVLAASSDFLRDQFLLHEGLAELSIRVFSSVEVGKRLLLSCYTGLLEVPLGDLVSYITAASALQMSQVVEQCLHTVSQYLSPTLAFLKLERRSGGKEIQQLDSSREIRNFNNLEEMNAAQQSSSIQEASTVEGKEDVVRSKTTVSQVAKGSNDSQRQVREYDAEIKISEDTACCPENQVHPIAGDEKAKLSPTTSFTDPISYRSIRYPHIETVDCSQDRAESELEELKEEEEKFSLEAQLQSSGELMDSNLLCLSGVHFSESHFTVDRPAEDTDSIFVQRPYLCRRCDTVFQHLESYVGHLKQHRQYLCLICEKLFSQRNNLTRHIRVRAGIKDFRCPLCHKTFSQRAALQDHLIVHTGYKPHKCKSCAVSSSHKAPPGGRPR